MDIKQHGFIGVIINTLCIIGVHISYAELTIDVTNTTCGKTYDISDYEKIILKYNDKDTVNVTFPRPSCMFNIVNYHTNKELCIKQTESDTWGYSSCSNLLNYFTGYLPPSHDGGIWCQDFENEPFCTAYSNVYAVFKDRLSYVQNSLTVEIYWRNMFATTTRRMMTTGYYSNYDYSEESHSDVSRATIVMIFIGVFVVCTACIIGCKVARLQVAVESPVHNVQQSVPQVSVQPANAADAPSYESLFQQQQQPPSNEGASEWQIHARVSGGLSPSQRHPEGQPSHHNSLETDLTSDPPVEDQTIPTAPPPSYSDLGFPPAYPGNT